MDARESRSQNLSTNQTPGQVRSFEPGSEKLLHFRLLLKRLVFPNETIDGRKRVKRGNPHESPPRLAPDYHRAAEELKNLYHRNPPPIAYHLYLNKSLFTLLEGIYQKCPDKRIRKWTRKVYDKMRYICLNTPSLEDLEEEKAAKRDLTKSSMPSTQTEQTKPTSGK